MPSSMKCLPLVVRFSSCRTCSGIQPSTIPSVCGALDPGTPACAGAGKSGVTGSWLQPLDDRDVGDAAAFAHRLQAIAAAAFAQRMDQRRHQLGAAGAERVAERDRSEEHTSELQSLMRISYAVFCLKKKKYTNNTKQQHNT